MVALADYAGREQAYVKHIFLESYLESLVFKTASVFNHIVYVDGFAGPWQSASERFEDTSFGIALSALRKAKDAWKKQGRTVEMTALLVERDPQAYARLATIPAKYPDIAIKTYPTDFIRILQQCGLAVAQRRQQLRLVALFVGGLPLRECCAPAEIDGLTAGGAEFEATHVERCCGLPVAEVGYQSGQIAARSSRAH